MHHVFIDCENVHTVDPGVIGGTSVKFTLLLGAKQTKLNVALVEKLMEHAASVHLVRLTSSGKNALDMAVAYYVGRAAVAEPGATFHIVSKDKGYDPLIEHLRTRQVHVRRHEDFAGLDFSGTAKEPVHGSQPLLSRVLEHLRKNTGNRPKRRKTLESHLLALAGKNSTKGEIDAVIAKLCDGGHITIDEKEAVTYHV